MYVQKVKIVGNCEKTTFRLSKAYLKVYGRLNGTLVTSGGVAPNLIGAVPPLKSK